jgi:excisionase family DNA binding protein
MSRPRAALAETRAVARAVAALGAKVERLTLAVEQLRAGQPSKLGRPEDAMRILGIGRTTLWRKVKDGSIPCTRVGKSARFDLAKLTSTDGPRA